MSKCGRNLFANLNTLAILTLAVVTGLSSPGRAGAQTTQTPSSYNFGDVAINETSLPENITVKNKQASAITINSYGVTGGPYAISTVNSTCLHPGSLAAGQTCIIAVTVEPTAVGAVPTGTLTLNTTATNSPQHVTFSATGAKPVTLSSTGYAFGSVVVGATSNTATIQLSNNQPTSVTIKALSFTPSANGFAFAGATTCSVNGQLTARSSCNIALTFSPTALGAAPATSLSVTTSQSATPITIPLTGSGIAPTTVSPASISFGNQVVGQTSLIKSFTLKNVQTTSLAISSIVAPAGGYAIDPSTTCAHPGNLAAGATCTVGVTFTPTALGATASGSAVTINTNANNSPQKVTVTGTGIAPTALSAASVNFGLQVVGQTSPIQSVTLTNYQPTNTLSVNSLSVTAGSPYAIDPSSTCLTPTVVPAGGTCTVAFTFTPTASGAAPSATATVSTNASNSPLSVTLSGSGGVATTLSPASVSFGSQVVNTTSATKTLTLKNSQSRSVTITGLVLAAPFKLDTSSNTTCPISGGTLSGTLNANSSCVIGVQFAPTATGATAGGLITVLDNAPNGPVQTTLSGSGIAPVAASPATLAFGNVPENMTSAAMNITVTNNQSVNLDFTSIKVTVGSPYAIYVPTTTCVAGTPVLPGKNCVISVTVSPASLGAISTASVTINDDAPSSPQTVNLTGTGVLPVAASPNPISFGTLVVGQETTMTTTVTNNLTTPIVIDSVASFAGGYKLDTSSTVTTCQFAPATLAAGQSCKIGIDVTPTATGSTPGTATLTYNASGSATMVNVPISMTGNAVQPVVVTPATVNFPTQFVGVQSPSSTVTVKNEQNVSLTIASITVAGTNPNDFSISSNLCPIAPAKLGANSNCTLTLAFKPTASGARTATLSVADNATGSPQTVTLNGTGDAPVLVSPKSITSFSAKVSQISAYQTVTITNELTTPLTNINFLISGDFEQTSTSCGTTAPYSLAGGASCNVTISFAPTIGGTRSGQLQVTDSAYTSPQVVNLQGNGTDPLILSTSNLTYSAQLVNTTSPAKVVTLTNNQTESASFSLTPAGPFSATNSCSSGTIAAKSSCNIYIDFSPTTTTPPSQSGSVTVTDSAPGGTSLVISLTGAASATNPAAAVAVVSPGAAAGGSSATVVNVTITGNGWTHFNNSSVITFPVTSNAYASDITVNSFTATGPNTINASITIAASPVFGARNIQVVSPLSGGGNETAKLTSAFIVSDPTQTFEITSITPGIGTQGQGYLGVAPLTVNIVATGTSFVQGTTYANFGDGVTVESLDITSPTKAQAVLAISNTTNVGYRSVTMVTGGQVANSILVNNNPLFYVGPNSATLTGVFEATVSGGVVTCTTTPVSEKQSFAGPVCLTATGTHFLQNATGVTITGGVTVGDTIVTSPTTAYSNVIVPANATIGVDSVTVATGGEIATLSNSFQVTGSTPGLLSVSPNSGTQGSNVNVVITGNQYTAFNACPGGVLVADFTGVISTGTIVVNSAHQVTIPISINENAPTGGIPANLTCGGAGSATIFPFGFTIKPSSASIVSVTPSSVPQGGQVTLSVVGSNTDWSQADTMSAFYPTPIATPLVNETTINSPTSAQLNISVPTNTPVGTYCFYMATGGQKVSACIQVYANTPTLTMSPANGLVPTSGTNSFPVSFTGQFTHFTQAGTVPVIAGEGVTLTGFVVGNDVSAHGTINIAAGAATGSRLVTFTTGGEIVTTYFNVTTIPVGIVSVSPWHGPQSTTMNVGIVGLNTTFVSGSTTVIFGGPQIKVNTVTVTDKTHLTANITTSYTPPGGSLTPTPPGWNSVYVNDPTEQLITGFLVDAPATPSLVSACVTADLPTCVSSAPQGSGGTNVTITGSLTNWSSSSELTMGAGITVANLTITGPTTATAVLSVSPTAPVGGNSVIMITPLTGGGFEYDSGVGFSVTPSAAYISNVSLPACQNPDNNATFIADFCNNGTSNIVPVVAQLQTSSLNVTGIGTHWLQGETTLSFGPGVVVDQLTINSPTSASVQITVLSSAPVGFATATAFTDGESASLQQAIDIEEGSPTFLAFSPQGAQQGATLNVEVLGRFTNWSSATPPVAEFNQDITINTLTVVDSETLILNVTVSPWAYVDTSSPCGHVLTITSGNEQVSSSQIDDNFCVSTGAQEITGVTPNAAGQGSSLQVTITGSQTNFLAGQTQVSFGDPGIQVGVPTNVTPTSLKVPILVTTTATPGFHNVTVTTYGQIATQVDAFTAAPTVAQLTEAISDQAEQGVQNLTVRLIGQYTHFSTSSTATFGAGITVVGTPTWVSDTEIDAVINISPISYVGGRTVTVTTPGISCAYQPPTNVNIQGVTYAGCTPGSSAGTGSEIVSANVFSIILGPAIITNVSPNTGNEGQEVVFNITGLDTHWQQNFTQFYIGGGGYDITINDVIINSNTSATVDMSISQTANPGPRSIYMVTAGESLTDSGAFVVTGGVPAISYLTPNSAQPGTSELQVTVVGNAYTQWAQGSSTVSFGPGITIDSQEVTDSSHIVADITIGATCTSPGVPVGCAQYGYRTVVVQTGTQALTGSFDVVAPPPPPTPYVWYEQPSSGIPGQTVSVYFYGANTEWNPNPTTGTKLTGWNSNYITVNTYQIVSPTEAIANITIKPNAPADAMALTFTTNGTSYNDNGTPGLEVDDASFNIVIAQPTLSIVDPGSGMQGAQNITVNILGQFTAFDSTTTFSFGGPDSGITVVGPPTILGPTIATQTISIAQEANTGGYSVVATTPDAPAIAQVVGGAGFSITPSLATILSVSPNTSAQGTQITVNVTGLATHWSPATTFTFGDGIVVTSVDVTSQTTATLTLAIPAFASEGTTSSQARTGGEVATLNQAFVVTAGTPYLLSSGPGSVEQQGAAVFTILAQATTWSSATPPVVRYGGDITLGPVQVTSPTTLTVQGAVSPTAYPGYRNLTVTAGIQVLSLNNAVYIGPGPAVINSVTPNTGGQGVTFSNVQIMGINTHWVQGVTTLTFPGVLVNSFTVTSPTTITADITVGLTTTPGQVNVTATTLGEVATVVNAFTITQTQAELAFINPSSLPQAQTQNLTITGIDTTFSTSSVVSSTSSGVTVNTVTYNSPTSLTVNVTVSPTISLGYKNITVTTGTQVVSSNALFQVTTGPAAISNLNPATGAEGQSVQVIVTGSQTHFSGATAASFGGGISVTGITVQSLTQATVNIFIPSSVPIGAYDVTLTTGGEVATILGGFTVGSGAPTITNVNPPTGTQGITTNVTLTGQFTSWVQGTSVASFGSGITVNSLTVNSATSALANITISQTATLGSRTVTVTTGAQVASITGGFSVLAGVPALTTAAPGTIQAGATGNIVITGVFTNFQQAFTTVSFGSGITVNFVTVSSFTQLTANITAASNAAVGGRTIQVDTNSQDLQLSGAFNVTAGTPVITEISPNVGTDGQTLNVTLTGLYTDWIQGTTTASFGSGITVNTVTVNATNSLVANITIGASAATGPYDVRTTTGGEVEDVPGGFTVEPTVIPGPTLLSISPGANAGGVPIDSAFTFVFSQPMNRTTLNTSTIEFWLVSNPGGWVTVPGTVTVDATGRVATFTPTSLLAVNSQYYLYMTSAIQNTSGTSFGNYGYVSFYTVASANTTPATVVAANPPANATNVGTNVTVELEFSTDMNQSTQTGLDVSTGGNPVAGTWSWNSNPYGQGPGWGPGTLLYFTPTSPLAANTTYKVSYGAPLADTAGNGLTPGSFTFTTGAAADTAQNYTGTTFNNYETNLGTNFAPTVLFSKPINPIDINTGTLLLYNADSGKYVAGSVAVAPNGLSATFTPTYALLPDTYYYIHMAWGDYDMDGNYLNGINQYFTTGASTDTTSPTVTFVSPANTATSVPLNSQIVVKFSTPLNENNISNVLTVTPSGGSAIPGTVSLAGDLVTMTFVPSSSLRPSKVYTIAASGFTDLVGNSGTPFSSTFTTAASAVVLNVSTGINASGQAILTGDTTDPHWSYLATTSTPAGESDILYPGCNTANYTSNTNLSNCTLPSPSGDTTLPAAASLKVVAPGEADWYSSWIANGPNSSWIAINPLSGSGNTAGFYYTTFTMPSPLPSGHICIVGGMSHDDSGLLAVNGTPIMSDQGYTGGSLAPLNIDITAELLPGLNYLNYAPGSTDNNLEGLNLNAAIEACGASITPGSLSLTSTTPANNATGVSTGTTIVMNFSNQLDPASVNTTTLPVMVGWNSNQEITGTYAFSNNNTTVTFTPAAPLPNNTQIWVGACGGPVDLTGDSLGGCYTQLFNFYTGPTVVAAGSALQVTASSPVANATNVGLRAPVYATFNRSINLGSINSSDFALYAGDGTNPSNSQTGPWCTSLSHSQDDATVSWNCYPLPSGTQMTMVLNSGISDWQGDTLTNFTSPFTTAPYDSNTNGSIISVRPGNSASGVNPNLPLILYSNLPINASTASSGIEVAQNNVLVPGTAQVLDGGYTLEFTPSVPFNNGALIQWWTTGSLYDTTYNTPINGDSGYFYTAGTTTSATPTVQVASPPEYTNPVATNTVFDVQFNTPINPSTIVVSGTPSIYLYDSTSGLNIAVTYSEPQANEVLMTPTTLPLPSNHYIYVEITSALKSTTSVPAQATSWWEYTGTATDTTLPTVTSAVPYNGATNVAVNDAPGVIVSKPIDPISVTSTTFQVLNGGTPLAGSFWFNSSNTRVEFVPNAPLPANVPLTMSINGITDREGHVITFSSGFHTGTTPDFTAPSVLFTSVGPNDGTPTNFTMAVTFSEPMDASTFTAGSGSSCGNFYIYDELSGDGIQCIATTLTWNSSQTIAYLTPNAPLAAGRQYYFSVSGGTDLAGNTMTGDSFYIYAEFNSSSAAPTVVNFNPNSGGTGLGTNTIIEAQFSAPIDPNYLSGVTLSSTGGPVAGTVVTGAGNTVVQFVPNVPLAPGTTYTMNISGVHDPAGNVVATVSNSFTTGATYDITAPYVVESVPVYDASVGTNIVPKFVFNKPLNPLTVNNSSFRIYLVDTGQFILSTVTLSSNRLEVTITPQIPLLPNTEYEFSGGWGVGPYDEDGNYYNLPWYYFWTTGGTVTTSPTVIISPATGTSGVPVNTLVQVAVSTPVDPTTVTQGSITLKNGSTPVSGTVTLANSQLLIFTPSTSATSPAQTYLGCYNDNQDGVRTLGSYEWSSNEMTVEQCVSSCGSRGYEYAGVQDGSQCWCGSGNYSSQGVSASCNMACTGNSAETCGGGSTNGVYSAQTEVVPQNLAAGTSYTANVSGFKDANGNLVTPASSSFTTAGTASSSYLYVTSTSPANNTSNNSSSVPIVMVFSNPLDPATVNGNTLPVTLGGCCGNEIAGTYALSNNNTTVTFTPDSPYPVAYSNPPINTNEIAINVSVCGPSDVLGQEAYGGCNYNLFYFYVNTGGTYTTPLQVTGVSPASGATNVGRDQSVSVTFNNSLSQGSLSNFNYQLYAGQGLQDYSSYTLSADNRTLTYNVGALYNNTNYTIMFPAGGVTDMWGNTLAHNFVSTFSTMADPATGNGSVLSSAPGNTTSVPVNTLLTLYLNRQVNASTLPGNLTVTVNGQVYTGTVQADASGYQVQFLPAVQFPNSATVQWFFSGNVLDIYGDNFNGASGYFYTVAAVNTATAQPTIVAVSPTCCNLQDVPTNAEVDIQYSLPLNPATVTTANIYQNTGPAIGYNVTLLSGNTVVRIKPTSNFNASTQYGFCTNSSVSGSNGVAAPADCWLTYFTTTAGTDTTSGTVTIGPPNGSQNVGTNAYIRVQFSKPADRTTVNSSTIAITTGGNPIPGSWSYNYSGSDLVGANFYPLNPLPQSSTIKVAVSGVYDYAGNQFSEPTITFQTGAQPDYNTPNVTLDFGSTTYGIGTNASFTCLYSEAMDPSSITNGGTYIYSYVTQAHVPVTYTFASDLMSVTMTPVSPLYADSEYYYECYNAIDLTGNAQNGNYSYFYTGSGPVAVGPSLVYANPPSGMTNVPLNSVGGPWNNTSLMLLFNEPVSSDSMNNITFTPSGGSAEPIAVYAEYGNYIADVQLPWTLAPNTTYTFNFAGVTDLNGNPAHGTTTSSFTTGTGFDWTNPTATAATPANNATGVAVNAPITLTFSELMNPALITSSQIYLRTHNTQTTVPTTLAISTVGGVTVVTLTPVSPLAESTIYDLVYWPNNWYLYDVAGNYESQYGVETTFTTGTTAAVNGACGTANGQSFSSPPTANLCTATGGIASAITNVAGAWSWTCNGEYGGTNAPCSATITGTPACFAQPSSLVSLWPGNNNANDVGPGGNNGTLENGVTYALGEAGDAFSFNGSNQYVLIGQPVPANLQIQNNFTLSAWIYVTSYPANVGSGPWQYIAGSEGPHNGIGLFLAGPVSGSYPDVPPGGIDLDIGNGSATYSVITTTQIPLNQWVLVTATATANNPAQIYYDGVLQPAITPSGETVWNGTVGYTGTGFAIGQYLPANYAFSGLINDTAVFKAALTQSQIMSIYNAGSGGICP
jgi:hypothetical protein